MKYYGEETKQDFIDEIYEGEMDIYYKDAIYTFWLDGNGYCIGLTGRKSRDLYKGEHGDSIGFADTVEELIDKYVLYDGAKLSDVIEMDVEDYLTMKPVKK